MAHTTLRSHRALPDTTPVPRPEHQRPLARRAGRAREPHITAGCRIRIDRKRARPYDGHGRHRLGSLLAAGATRAEEGFLTFNGDTTILTHQAATSPEHGRVTGQDAQIVRPSTAARTVPVQGQCCERGAWDLAYHAVPCNSDAVAAFRTEATRHWNKALRAAASALG